MEHATANTKQVERGREAGSRRGSGSEPGSARHPAVELQQLAGNQAMQALLRSGAIRAKLAISQPGDAEEQEADAMAGRVMRSHAGPGAATASSCSCGEDEGGMCDECRQNASISRKASGQGGSGASSSGSAGASVHKAIGAILRSPGRGLDTGARAFFEPRFGRDFGDVRVHTDGAAADSAREIRAHAYTAGQHLVFDAGRYAPESEAGRRLLAHELTHVVQQRGATSSQEAQASHSAAALRINNSGEANAERVTRNLAVGRPPGVIDVQRLSVQRQLFEAPPIEQFGNPGELGKFGEMGKYAEWGKLGEWGKSSPPTEATPLPEPAPLPETTPAPTPEGTPSPNPSPGTTPKPWLNPYPIPYVGPMPQPTEDEERRRDSKCGTKEMPLSMVTFTPGPLGQGGRVKASPLTKCPGNTIGSPPDGSIYRQEFDCINAAGQAGSWVRAHILHGETSSSGPFNLHGPGNDKRNLIITDKSLNSLMSSRAERPVINSVYRNNAVMWYDASVDAWVGGRESFARTITVRAGMYDTNTNTEGPALPFLGGTFPLQKDPPNCPPGAAPAGGGTSPAVQGVTPPVPQGATAMTPTSNLEFQSTIQICAEELASRSFKVTNGGLEVMISADWFNKAGDEKMAASACPFDHYYVLLEQSGTFWGFNQYSQKPIKIPVGQRILPLKWTGLKNDTYRLKIYVDSSLEGPQPGEGSYAPIKDPPPPCCLQGDITVSTFYAPDTSGMPTMA